MTEPDPFDGLDAEERALAAELSEALSAPVPPATVEGARAAFAWRRFDEELATLVESESLAGVRGDDADLAFADVGGHRIELNLATERGRTVVTGQLVPPVPPGCAGRRGRPRPPTPTSTSSATSTWPGCPPGRSGWSSQQGTGRWYGRTGWSPDRGAAPAWCITPGSPRSGRA